MNALAAVLAVLFLLDPDAGANRRAAAEISADADRVYEPEMPAADVEKKMRIVSRSGDFDRTAGVAMFEGGVVVSYGSDCTLASDQLYVFLAEGTNKLDRIVAVGGVAITNATRIGKCAMARFRRQTSEIDMFGGGPSAPATFADAAGGSSVEGSRIRFWLDTEQVEVERSAIRTEKSEGKVLL